MPWVAMRKPARGRQGADRTAAFDDARALADAFRGADAVFAMIPPSYGEDDFGGYQDRAGAQHPEGTGPIQGLHRQEKRLNGAGGLKVVHLRPSYFMEAY